MVLAPTAIPDGSMPMVASNGRNTEQTITTCNIEAASQRDEGFVNKASDDTARGLTSRRSGPESCRARMKMPESSHHLVPVAPPPIRICTTGGAAHKATQGIRDFKSRHSYPSGLVPGHHDPFSWQTLFQSACAAHEPQRGWRASHTPLYPTVCTFVARCPARCYRIAYDEPSLFVLKTTTPMRSQAIAS